MSSLTMPKLPIIDLTNENSKPGSSVWVSLCTEIKHAFEEFGCFVALYDKISPELDKAIFNAAEELFNLPTEIKVQNIYEKPYHGYVKVPFLPLHEGLGMDNANNLEGAQSFTKLMWPHGNEPFCETSLQFARAIADLDHTVVNMLFESYGIEKYSDSYIDSTTYLLRYLKYEVPTEGEINIALPTHVDKSFTTILYQNQISGLEIQKRDGEWISVEFPPKSFVVMAGITCKAWSNDRVLAPNHRVTLNKAMNKTRYAMAQFSSVNKKIEVPEELLDNDHPIKYKPFFHGDLLEFCASDHGLRSQNILKDFCGV